MLRRLYDRVLVLSARPSAPWWLMAVSFAESSVFPVPPDVLLVPMIIARPERAWRLAALCTLASVAGGLLGYFIGYALYDRVAIPLIQFYHYQAAAYAFVRRFNEWGLWVILIKGLTPIPFKIVTITSGIAHFSLPVFIAASFVTRGCRFFVLAALLRKFGAPAQVWIERRLGLVTAMVAIGIFGGFVVLKVM